MGEILALTAGCLFSLGLMLSQLGMRQASASAGVMVNIIFNNLVFWSFAVYMFFQGGLPAITIQGVMYAIGGGIAANVLGRTLNFEAVRRIGAARAVSLSLSQTLFAFIFSTIIFRDIPGKQTIIGMLLVIGGVYWLSREQVQRQKQNLLSRISLGQISAALESGLPSTGRDDCGSAYYSGIILAILAGLAFSLADLSRKMSLVVMPSAILSSAIGGLAALTVQTFVFTQSNGWGEIKALSRRTLLLLSGAGILSGMAVLTLNTALSFSSIVIVNSLYNIRVWVPIVLGPLILGIEGKITKVLVLTTFLILSGTLLIILK